MSIQSLQATITRLQKQVADIRTKDATEARNEGNYNSKAGKAAVDASKAKSISTVASKLKEAEQAQRKAADCGTKRAKYAKDLASAFADLAKNQNALTKEEDNQRRKVSQEIDRQQQLQQRRQREIERAAVSQVEPTRVASVHAAQSQGSYDAFICHASEDKAEIVDPLAEKATAAGLELFYDATSLKWGDNLTRVINHGLANSKFGVVILSPAFFAKEWPQRELDGLLNLEIDGKTRILPIWHKISKDEVMRLSPLLAGKVALNTATLTIDEIVAQLTVINRLNG